MDKPYFKDQITKHKALLHQLYLQNQVTKTLNHTSDEGLNFLLRFIFLIVNGHVSLKPDTEEIISKSLRCQTQLEKFEKRKYLKEVLASSRENKLKELKIFGKLYNHLFYYVFNRKK